MPRMTVPTKRNVEKRDAELFQLYESGMTLTMVGQLYGLSKQRIHQIVINVKYKRGLDNT